jgi:hypothetical protein
MAVYGDHKCRESRSPAFVADRRGTQITLGCCQGAVAGDLRRVCMGTPASAIQVNFVRRKPSRFKCS